MKELIAIASSGDFETNEISSFFIWKYIEFQFCLAFCCTWRIPMSQSSKSAHITKEAKLFAR